MFSGEYRRSPRIVELDARKAQARSQNKGNGICQVIDGEEIDKGQDILKRKHRRKKVKARTVQDLVVNSVEYKVEKTDTRNGEDHVVDAATMPSGIAIPEQGKLELLLSILQRRDAHNIFAKPVNAKEVEHYYDVIKEPMDFGTVAKKLNEGSYHTLEEFEHDVMLVPNNGLLFNASNTIYYRQSRALKELATQLFQVLKSDPENFKAEASLRRMGLGKRTRTQANSSNKNSIGSAARGYKAERKFDDFEVDKRQSYVSLNSFVAEHGSLISSVYNSPKLLKLDEDIGVGYVESLKRFVEDMGPIAQTVAMKKVESYINEAMKFWNSTKNQQPWAPEMQIPNSVFVPKSIKVAPSFKVPSSTPGCQNKPGNEMDIQGGFSNGGQASIHGTMNKNYTLNRGISQPLGDLQEKMTQSASNGFSPSLFLPGYSWLFGGETMDNPFPSWSGRKVSAYSLNINNAADRDKGKAGNIVDFQGRVIQPMRGVLDTGAAFSDYVADPSNGVHLGSFPGYNSGKGKLSFTASCNTKSKPKESSLTSMLLEAMSVENTVQEAGQTCLGLRTQEFTPTRYGTSSSLNPPSRVKTGFGFQASDPLSGIVSHYTVGGLNQKSIADMEGSRDNMNVEQEGQFFDWFSPVESLTGKSVEGQTISSEMKSIIQEKKDLDSLCDAPPLEDWLWSLPLKHIMKESENAMEYGHGRVQPEYRGESSNSNVAVGLPKQPMLGLELPKWPWL